MISRKYLAENSDAIADSV